MLRAVCERRPDFNAPIITGVSAGAINAFALAGHPGSFAEAVSFLDEEWRELTSDRVYRVPATSLLTAAFRWLGRRLFRQKGSVVHGLLRMEPLAEFLGLRLELSAIEGHLAGGRLRSVALSATEYGSGETVTFVHSRDQGPLWRRAQRRAERTPLDWNHVLASAAIPLVFPAIKVGRCYYGDGSVRQVAPLAPAVHLGAGRILAIGMRSAGPGSALAKATEEYPSAAQAMGLVFNSMFLGALDADAERLERINQLLTAVPQGTSNSEGLRPVGLQMIRPSMDLGALARPHFHRLPPLIRAVAESIGGQREGASDFISYLLFDPAYTVPLMELGYDDANDQWDAIESFLAS